MKALTLKVEAHVAVSIERIFDDMRNLARQLDCQIESRACGDKLVVKPDDTWELFEARRVRLREIAKVGEQPA